MKSSTSSKKHNDRDYVQKWASSRKANASSIWFMVGLGKSLIKWMQYILSLAALL